MVSCQWLIALKGASGKPGGGIVAIIYSFERDPKKREVVDGNSLSMVYCDEEKRYLTEAENWLIIDRLLARIFSVLDHE